MAGAGIPWLCRYRQDPGSGGARMYILIAAVVVVAWVVGMVAAS